ncbi:Ubiquitin-conjugating enzyme 15 [Zea mays]|uniref:Ubiquitin-conjugating enzyme 15 n=1 Tax=Zea mays TaxID=4577 RepID=A0A1D6GKI8_MAIZE|nr:Ubiquitin-conjugating enzyme 15 [Zea mays]
MQKIMVDETTTKRWVVDVAGAPGTLYTGETYKLQVDFSEHYPMEAPQVIFLHPAPMHPHIYSNGHICLGIAVNFYSPVDIFWTNSCILSSPALGCSFYDMVLSSWMSSLISSELGHD